MILSILPFFSSAPVKSTTSYVCTCVLDVKVPRNDAKLQEISFGVHTSTDSIVTGDRINKRRGGSLSIVRFSSKFTHLVISKYPRLPILVHGDLRIVFIDRTPCSKNPFGPDGRLLFETAINYSPNSKVGLVYIKN